MNTTPTKEVSVLARSSIGLQPTRWGIAVAVLCAGALSCAPNPTFGPAGTIEYSGEARKATGISDYYYRAIFHRNDLYIYLGDRRGHPTGIVEVRAGQVDGRPTIHLTLRSKGPTVELVEWIEVPMFELVGPDGSTCRVSFEAGKWAVVPGEAEEVCRRHQIERIRIARAWESFTRSTSRGGEPPASAKLAIAGGVGCYETSMLGSQYCPTMYSACVSCGNLYEDWIDDLEDDFMDDFWGEDRPWPDGSSDDCRWVRVCDGYEYTGTGQARDWDDAVEEATKDVNEQCENVWSERGEGCCHLQEPTGLCLTIGDVWIETKSETDDCVAQVKGIAWTSTLECGPGGWAFAPSPRFGGGRRGAAVAYP